MTKFKLLSIGLMFAGFALMAFVGIPDANASITELIGPAGIAFGGSGMIFSEELKFSNNQDLSQVAATYASTNIIDTGSPGTVYGAAAALAKDAGPGHPIPVLVQVTETFTSGGAATLQVQIETDTDEGMATNNEVIAQSRVYALAELVAGMQFEVQYLPNRARQFLRVNYIIGTATTTAGTCTAGIVAAVQAPNDNQPSA